MKRRTRKNPTATIRDFTEGPLIPDAVVADLAGRGMAVSDAGGGAAQFTLGGVNMGPPFTLPAASWSGVAGRPFGLTSAESTSGLVSADIIDTYPPGDIRRYGAVREGNPTATAAAIQKAIDAAAASPNKSAVFIPEGDWYITQIVMKKGVWLYGVGIGGFGTIGTNQGTRLRQVSNQNKSAIIYDEPQSENGRTYAGPAAIAYMEISCPSAGASTLGYGIDFTAPDGRLCTVQDTLRIDGVLVRGFPQGGMNFPQGALPLHLRNCNLLYNGGPGISYTKGSLGSTQAVEFDNISGDGNIGGLIHIDNGGIDVGQFLIINLKSEKRINSAYGGVAGQDNAIVLVDCPAPVTIVNANHYSSTGSGVVPGPLVHASGSVPRVSWFGTNVQINSGDTGTPAVLYDAVNSVYVPATVRNGDYGGGLVDSRHLSGPTSGRWNYGMPGAVMPSIATHSVGVSGPTPVSYLWETDAPADRKLWSLAASAGNLTIRTHTDAGSAGVLAMEMVRSGTTVSAVRFAGQALEANSLEATAATGALILKAPNGTRYRVTVSNAGALTVTAI